MVRCSVAHFENEGKTVTKKRAELTTRQQYWLDCIEECERSGQSLKAYAEEREIPVATLYSWKKKLKQKGLLPERRSRFQRVRIAEALPPSDWRIDLPNGVQVTWSGPVDGAELSAVLAAALQAG